MLAMSAPQAGQHHDLFEIQTLFTQLTQLLEAAGIDLRGGPAHPKHWRSVFLNTDPGFDAAALREVCRQHDIQANIKPNPRNARQ
jgi:hypothetical protein